VVCEPLISCEYQWAVVLLMLGKNLYTSFYEGLVLLLLVVVMMFVVVMVIKVELVKLLLVMKI